ncbi:ABC transporter ATP-binding protein [Paenibacillus turpanensis]|uniref:ABC transporter ATP-binding protein n=1 Tax=Paenibacillus turpanensis TaxID=2689078 RepID=UPI0014090304|nr:ABC transporter ATP-binding protein [Paenibacillus turpanensis]
MLTVRNVTKQIDDKTILEQISFDIQPGTITGLVGRNGVGKSTLLRLMAGIIDPDEGEILINGVNLTQQPLAKKSMFYVPDTIVMFNGYSVKELVEFHRRIYEDFDLGLFYDWLDRFNLPANRPVRSFSKGMKALLFIILALSTGAKVILLDEPTNGLDIIIKKQMMQLLIEEVSERQISLVISSHHLLELEKMADVIVMLRDTRIDSVIRVEELRQKYKKLQLAFSDGSSILKGMENIQVLTEIGRVTTLLIKDNIAQTLQTLESTNPILMEELPVTIEDVFIGTLGGDAQYVS